jgi:hypothetical protein
MDVGERVVAAVGEAGAKELLRILLQPPAERAEPIGRLYQRDNATWLAELLIDVEEDEPARLKLSAELFRVI